VEDSPNVRERDFRFTSKSSCGKNHSIRDKGLTQKKMKEELIEGRFLFLEWGFSNDVCWLWVGRILITYVSDFKQKFSIQWNPK